MVSKSQIKLITSLSQKKYRVQHQLFVAEGVKTIQELLNSSFELFLLFTTKPFNSDAKTEILITEKELQKISFQKSPNQALAVFKIPEPKPVPNDGLILALDSIRDPGNLGTIIRLCDWFGVTDLVCSETTTDCYNPKVVQASMGSLARVNLHYLHLENFIKEAKMPVYGAFMEGENVYQSRLPERAILVMGNEANGITNALQAVIPHKITIPRFGAIQATESLNVATAAAVLLSEFKRSTTGR
ncbi:MAG TPA: RNA methyltransferase [Flavobacteriaceae bacterium]|nr:RNA methyltransferase [Flavobacteriaceae bacterium]